MKIATSAAVIGAVLWTCPGHVEAQVVAYTDEATFLDALTSLGHPPVLEGFEDDTAWGAVRSTISGGNHTAPSISNLGITWSSSSANNEITTGSGAARTGNWGFFSLPHGDYDNLIGDGFHGVAAQPLVAIGGWIETNTPPAKLGLFLNGDLQNPIDFGANEGVLDTQPRFFGAIDPSGFTVFDFRELEGTIGDQKFIFSDDFTFAFGGSIIDCNDNGIADATDVALATSPDCNNNTVPDECEIPAESQAPGGPYFCTEFCGDDCNVNGLLDECEVVAPLVYASGSLSPIGFGSPQSFTIESPPETRANVVLEFLAYANLGGLPDHISVDVNGVPVGTVFGETGSDCPEVQPDSARLYVPSATFNAAVAGGDAVIGMVASEEVAPAECDSPTYIVVEAALFVPSDADADGNGIVDECADVPTVSEWGLLVLALLLVTAGSAITRQRADHRRSPE